MSAQHITAAAIVVDIAREKAIRDALDRLLAAADDLARAAGVERISLNLGTQPAIYEVAVRAGWDHYINPGANGVGFGVATCWRRPACPSVYGPDIPAAADLAPAADVNPIVIRPLGLGA